MHEIKMKINQNEVGDVPLPTITEMKKPLKRKIYENLDFSSVEFVVRKRRMPSTPVTRRTESMIAKSLFSSKDQPKKNESAFIGHLNVQRDEFHKNYTIIRKITDGAFSEVYHARKNDDQMDYVVKVIKLLRKHGRMKECNETNIYENMRPNHRNILHCFWSWTENDEAFLTLERCVCTFDDLLMIRRVNQDELLIFLGHTLSGLNYLHDRQITHMDVKSENIMLSFNGVYKLADFELSVNCEKVDKDNIVEGDPRYLAPEVLFGIITPLNDVFALGMSCIEAVYTISLPPNGPLYHTIRNCILPRKPHESFSQTVLDIIKSMLLPFNIRPDVKTLLNYEQIKERIDWKSTFTTEITSTLLDDHTLLNFTSPPSESCSSLACDAASDSNIGVFTSTPFVPKKKPNQCFTDSNTLVLKEKRLKKLSECDNKSEIKFSRPLNTPISKSRNVFRNKLSESICRNLTFEDPHD